MAQIWRLKKGADRRIRQGHPWVFSHEVETPIRNFHPQEVVELQSAAGEFLARGYGNLESKIIFRALDFSATDKNPLSMESFQKKLQVAWKKRASLGYKTSFRLCFSEADGVPGLIVDRYYLDEQGKPLQVLAVQVLTAGIQRALPDLVTFFQKVCTWALEEKLSSIPWDETLIVLRNDVNVRKLEGLEVEFPRFLKTKSQFEPSKAWITLKHVTLDQSIQMCCDLYQGQKTGFFLDQTGNILAVAQELSKMKMHKETFRILDLCSYVGHWSVQIGTLVRSMGIPVHATLVDVSQEALKFSESNMKKAGLEYEIQRRDVLKGLDSLPSQEFDLVIADPPAFVKAKKDLPTGKHAYQKLNTQAVRLVKTGGYLVSCSCSGLITEEDLKNAVQKALDKNQRTCTFLARGGPAADHPGLEGFFEGAYLKMLLHRVD